MFPEVRVHLVPRISLHSIGVYFGAPWFVVAIAQEVHKQMLSTVRRTPVATLPLKAPMRSEAFVTVGYWSLVRNEGMEPQSSPHVTHYNRSHCLFHSFIPS